MKSFEPGLFDKLFRNGPSADGHAPRRWSVEAFKQSVARDIEELLNARTVLDEETLKIYRECQRSILTFGVPDICGLSMASDSDRTRICTALARTIARHERRLSSVAAAFRHIRRPGHRHGARADQLQRLDAADNLAILGSSGPDAGASQSIG